MILPPEDWKPLKNYNLLFNIVFFYVWSYGLLFPGKHKINRIKEETKIPDKNWWRWLFRWGIAWAQNLISSQLIEMGYNTNNRLK